MAPKAPTPTDLRNGRPVYCLDLDWGGVRYRVATAAIDITRADGSVIHYADALSDPQFVEEYNRTGTQTGNSVPLAVYLDGVDIAQEVAQGYRLEAVRGHLFMVFVDRDTLDSRQTYPQRYPLLTGRLSQPVYADPDRDPGYLAFTLDDNPGDDTSILIDAESSISTLTWGSGVPSDSIGKVYPTIIGTPGLYRLSTGEPAGTSGSPAYPIAVSGTDFSKLLIAGHQVTATSVKVFDTDDPQASDTLTVSHELDGLGRLCAVVDISSAGSLSKTSAEYWVVWNQVGGGIQNPFKAGALTGLGDVCAWALLRTSLPVDLERWIAEAGVLNRVQIDTYINEPTLTPWSFVTRLLDDLLVEVRAGPQGVYPHGRLLDLATAEGLATLTEGPEFEPAGPVTSQTQLGDVINEVTIKFARKSRTGDFKRALTVSPLPSDSAEVFSDEYAVISANRWSTDPQAPIIQSETLTLSHVYDETTASLIARERVRALGLGYSTRPYLADVRMGWLMPGDQFKLDSDSLHRSFFVTVMSKTWTGIQWAFVVALDEDPVRISSLKDY